ncbi:MAG: molybdopterin-dependent oxidoreductase [Syntrophaceae bacterium]|nr:molybdopterin-dependent oxidoreductase [Syntrophaceae bacterium]
MEIRKSWCGLCHVRCGILLQVENGRAVRVKGDPDHPLTRGSVCMRCGLLLEQIYHEGRLNFPLKRDGKKGEDRWKRIRWETGLVEVAEKLNLIRRNFGPEALAFFHGTYRTHHWPGKRFFNLFGSPNMTGTNHICMCPSHAVEWATYGSFAGSDLRHSSLIVLWGHGPANSYPVSEWEPIEEATRRGTKLMVIDPRRTTEADKADLCLQIRPGMDLPLMLAWMKVMIDEGLYDREFVDRWTVGFAELKKELAGLSLDDTAQLTWLTEDQIVRSARMYAMTKPGVISFGLGVDKQGFNANQAERARCILRALAGNIDVPGGELIGTTGDVRNVVSQIELELNDALSPEQKARQLGVDRYRLMSYQGWDRIVEAGRKSGVSSWKPPDPDMIACAHPNAVWKAILEEKPYPVKAMIILASNPLLCMPNPRLIHDALKKLDLLVVVDYFPTPTGQMADYLFPAAGTIERSDLIDMPFGCIPCPKGIEPLYERRSDYEFWRGLALRMGQETHWPWATMEEVIDYRLAGLDMNFQQLVEKGGILSMPEFRKYEKEGFATPSGKVEIASSIFRDLGYDDLPRYRDVNWPGESAEYPLVMTTGSRFLPIYHSEQRQLTFARRLFPDPLVYLHPETAEALGLKNSERVQVASPFGRIRMKLQVSEAIHPRSVEVQHGWWFPEKDGREPLLYGVWESNVNLLCPDGDEWLSPEIGSWPLTGIPARVSRIKDPES